MILSQPFDYNCLNKPFLESESGSVRSATFWLPGSGSYQPKTARKHFLLSKSKFEMLREKKIFLFEIGQSSIRIKLSKNVEN